MECGLDCITYLYSDVIKYHSFSLYTSPLHIQNDTAVALVNYNTFCIAIKHVIVCNYYAIKTCTIDITMLMQMLSLASLINTHIDRAWQWQEHSTGVRSKTNYSPYGGCLYNNCVRGKKGSPLADFFGQFAQWWLSWHMPFMHSLNNRWAKTGN